MFHIQDIRSHIIPFIPTKDLIVSLRRVSAVFERIIRITPRVDPSRLLFSSRLRLPGFASIRDTRPTRFHPDKLAVHARTREDLDFSAGDTSPHLCCVDPRAEWDCVRNV